MSTTDYKAAAFSGLGSTRESLVVVMIPLAGDERRKVADLEGEPANLRLAYLSERSSGIV